MPLVRGPGPRASPPGCLSVDGSELEDRDLALGLLLVRRVRRPGVDGELPQIGALLTLDSSARYVFTDRPVLELDLGVGAGSCSTTPAGRRPRPWTRWPRRRRRARRASPGSCGGCRTWRRREVITTIGSPVSRRVLASAAVGRLELRNLVADPLGLARDVFT